MQATAQLAYETALDLHGFKKQPWDQGEHSDATRELLQTVADLGLEIKPQFPGQTHPLLVSFFLVDIPDMEKAEEVLTQLRKLDSVEAAYLTPPAELPASVEF